MIGSTVLLIMALVSAPAGQVTATMGEVRITRGGQPLAASLSSGLEPGDRVTTGPGSGVGLFLYDGQSIYLGAEGALAIPASGEPQFRLERGEARATVDSSRGLTIVAGRAWARVDRGTVWAAAAPSGVRFRVDHGSAQLSSVGKPPLTLPAGQEATLSAADELRGPTQADPTSWTLRVGALQLAGAAAESRRTKQDQISRINDEAASEFASGQAPAATGAGGTTPGTSAPVTAATQPGATNQPAATDQPADEAYQPIAVSQTNTSFSSVAGSLALSGASGAFSFASSGGLGNDAQQDSLNPAFPGNIFLVTAESRYSLTDVKLTPKDLLFPTDRQYYSIGVGAPPTGQVVTNFLTGTGAVPQSIRIPHFNAYVLNLSQFGIADPAGNPSNSALTGISGLLGAHPLSPQIQGATPLLDPRASFNNRATFALGEFALQRDPNNSSVPQIEIRRSDQDRLIVPGTGLLDPATPNPQIFPRYVNVKDFKFFPEFPNGVKAPANDGFQPLPTLSGLDPIRKAAVTTLLADKLFDYSHRTGQTLFVIDGQIINTAGFRRSLESPAPGASVASVAAATARPGPVTPARPAGPSLRSFGPRPEAGRTGAAAQIASTHRTGRHH